MSDTKHKLTLYYFPQNNGDGSASIPFFESKELAEWHQKKDDEGFCDWNINRISLESESPIILKSGPSIKTKYSYLMEELFDDGENLEKFLSTFFPEGLPTFRFILETPNDEYTYVQFYVGEEKVARHFLRIEEATNLEQKFRSLKV